ncbi:MAG: hypothetical protein ACPG4Y_06580 [Chitinophagales bacterium]
MLENSYYLLSALMLCIVLGIYIKQVIVNISDTKARLKKIIFAVIPFALWLVYLSLIQGSSIIQDLNLPPKFPILILLPLAILFVLFYFFNRKNNVLLSIPKHYTIAIQSFRILVEYILLYTFYKGIIPATATFEGLNFDILIALSAPFIAFLVYKNLNKYRDIARYWNIFGIFMILFVAFIIGTSIYIPSLWNADAPLVSMQFLSFPYFLIAGFLAPLGIFLHVVSLLQLRKAND